ncbi:MAG: hypothetical protein OEQ16_14700, partial [Gammaproteobacteria bacterium]|nr:hypothetical protein [Gammaproteobacteria bacterium]
MRTYLLAILLGALSMSPVHGGDMDISGSVELQARGFWQNPQWVGQDDRALQGSVISTTEVR